MCRVSTPLPTEDVETMKEGAEQEVGCRVAVSNYLSEIGLTSRPFLEAGLKIHVLSDQREPDQMLPLHDFVSFSVYLGPVDLKVCLLGVYRTYLCNLQHARVLNYAE